MRDALIALRKDIDDSDTLSGFAMECVRMAGKSPELWKDREWAQERYAELLTHAGLLM